MYAELSDYIQKFVLNEEDIFDTRFKKNAYRVLKVTAMTVGGISGIPFINSAKKAAFSIEFLEYYFSIGTVISFGVGSAWAWHKVSEELAPTPRELLALTERTKYKYIRAAMAMAIGLLVSAPSSYSAYKYNNNSFLLSAITLVSGYGLHAYANFKAFELHSISERALFLTSRFNVMHKERLKVLALKKELLNRIGLEKKRVLSLNDPEKRIYLLDLARSEPEAFISKIIEPKEHDMFTYRKEKGYRGGSCFFNNVLSFIFPLIFGYVNFLLVREGAEKVDNNPVFSFLMGLLSVIPFLFLEVEASRNIFGSIFESVYSQDYCSKSRSELANYMPQSAALLLRCLTILLAIGASSSRFFISYDKSAETSLFFSIMTLLGGCVFQLYSNFDSVNLISRNVTTLAGSEIKKMTAKMMNKFSKLEKLFEEMPLGVLVAALKDVQSERLKDLLKAICPDYENLAYRLGEAMPLLDGVDEEPHQLELPGPLFARIAGLENDLVLRDSVLDQASVVAEV